MGERDGAGDRHSRDCIQERRSAAVCLRLILGQRPVVVAGDCPGRPAGEQNTRVFNTILSTSPDLTCTVDLKTHLSYANRTLLEFFNLTLDQIVGKPLAALPGTDTEELQRLLIDVLKTREHVQGELAATANTGEFRVFDYIVGLVLNETNAIEAVTITPAGPSMY
jgi:PAS domain S-box-containing protein